MQDVREDATRSAQRARKRIGNGAEDETTGSELGEIGDHRCHQIAEIELAGLHEVTDGVLGRREGAHQRAADIPADVARLGGVVGEGCCDGLPACQGRVRALGRRSSGVACRAASAIGGSSGVVQPGSQGIGSAVGVPAAVVAATFSPCATSRAVAVSSPDRAICHDSWSQAQPVYIA